jgi:peptidoglycan/xylan/chitin deacetylase (PgdA/CDA1 family)
VKGTLFHRVLRQWKRLEARVVRGNVVLLYHRIASDVQDPFGLCVDEKHFDEHLDVVHRLCGRPPVFLKDLFSSTEAPRVAITFDDGYEDNLRCGLPILERHDAPATFFLTSATPGRPYWWDVLAAASLDEVDRVLARPGKRGVSGGEAGARARRRSAHERLVSMPANERRPLIEALERTLTGDGVQLPKSLNEEEVRTLGGSPLAEIGAHTHSHADLGRASDACRSEEIVRNRELLTELTGAAPASFAFPYGTFPSAPVRVGRFLREEGFQHACLAEPGVVRASTDPFRIPRLWVRNQDGEQLERSLRTLLG